MVDPLSLSGYFVSSMTLAPLHVRMARHLHWVYIPTFLDTLRPSFRENKTHTDGQSPLVAFITSRELGRLLHCHYLGPISRVPFYPSFGAVLFDFFHAIFIDSSSCLVLRRALGMRAIERVDIVGEKRVAGQEIEPRSPYL